MSGPLVFYLVFCFLIPLSLVLACGTVQYLITAKVKDRVVRGLLLIPLPLLGLCVGWILYQNPIRDLDVFGFHMDLAYVACALVGTFLGWLLGWAKRWKTS